MGQRYQLLLNAGFNQGQALVMTAISMLECASCSFGSINATGDVGMMQINQVHWGSSDPTRTVFGDLTDPAISAQAAFAVFNGAGGQQNPTAGYQQWCTYPGGCGGASPTSTQAFNALLEQVAGAVQGVTQTDPSTGAATPPSSSGAASSGVQPGTCDFTPTDCSQISGPVLSGPGGLKLDLSVFAQTACQVQNSLGQVGQFFCNVGSMLHYFTVRGHWWQIGLVAAGVLMVLVGVTTYLNPNIASSALGAAEAM